jgi:hypothetical protein
MLRQVADGVLIHQSELCQSNAVVVQGRAGVLRRRCPRPPVGPAFGPASAVSCQLCCASTAWTAELVAAWLRSSEKTPPG